MSIQWKPVVGYEKNYEVSDTGMVRNTYNKQVVKGQGNGRGYLQVGLSLFGKVQMVKVHRIVATAFIPNPSGKLYVDHFDGNRKNNHVSNLRWATKQENCQNSGLRSDNSSGFKGVSAKRHKWRTTIQIDGIAVSLGCYNTPEEAAIAYNTRALQEFGQFACINVIYPAASPAIKIKVTIITKN